MTITLKPKHFIIGGLIALIGFSGYYFRDKFQELFASGGEMAVNNALIYLKNTNENNTSDGLTLFSTDYMFDVLSNYSYYKIEEWKLKSKSIDNGKYKIDVEGTTVNGFGAKLERTPTFIVEKQNDIWVITDSYDFAVIDKMETAYGKSDLEKHKMMEDMKEKVKIEDWTFSSSYGGSVKGNGTIVNNSVVAVSFVKFVIEYKDKSGNIVNTDETYAVGADDLLPGQRRKFEWYTSNCYDCNTASSRLNFDR
jgi:hypothetical protein